jgi:hypothetical protein
MMMMNEESNKPTVQQKNTTPLHHTGTSINTNTQKTYLVQEIQDFGKNMCAFSGIHRSVIKSTSFLQNSSFLNVLERISTS